MTKFSAYCRRSVAVFQRGSSLGFFIQNIREQTTRWRAQRFVPLFLAKNFLFRSRVVCVSFWLGQKLYAIG